MSDYLEKQIRTDMAVNKTLADIELHKLRLAEKQKRNELRDQFAMAALQGMLTDTRNGDDHESEIACMAYAYADAMLEAREQ